MTKSTKFWFAALVFSQAVHSFEEIHFELWRHFSPARYLGSLFSNDTSEGFIIANAIVLLLGLISVTISFCVVKPWVKNLLFFWIFVEVVNISVHVFNAYLIKGYFPGLYTAPLLLFCSISLILSLRNNSNQISRT